MGKHEQRDELFDPPVPKSEAEHPGLHVADVMRKDDIPPPATLLDNSGLTIGTEPIPASRYFSQEFADLERDKLWPKVWQFACWGYDIPNPGDIHVYRILDRSVLLVRQRDGSVKAFINACLHRGRELCEADDHQGELKCPYHFFTWGLEGGLKFVPSQWDFPQVDAKNFQLPEVRIEEWNGFLFINFDKDAMPLKHYMGRMVEQWKDWDFSATRFKAVHVEKQLSCNWKTGQDAFIEGFHAFASHSQGAALSPSECPQVDVYEDSPHTNRFHILIGYPSTSMPVQPDPQTIVEIMCANLLPEAMGTDEARLQPGEDSRAAIARIYRKFYSKNYGVDTSNLSTAEALDALSYFVFPNFMPWPSWSFPLIYRFRPGATPDTCIWDIMLFLPFEGERPPSAEVIRLGLDDSLLDVAALGPVAMILHQDAVQVPAVQRGMKNLVSGLVNPSRYQEMRIRHYHQTLEKYLGL